MWTTSRPAHAIGLFPGFPSSIVCFVHIIIVKYSFLGEKHDNLDKAALSRLTNLLGQLEEIIIGEYEGCLYNVIHTLVCMLTKD